MADGHLAFAKRLDRPESGGREADRRLLSVAPGPYGRHGSPRAYQAPGKWLKSYRPEELFDKTGRLIPTLAELAPIGERRMSANPHANGGLLLRDLRLPDFRTYGVAVPQPGAVTVEATRVQGVFMRDVVKANRANFRIFSPTRLPRIDGTRSSRSRPAARPLTGGPATIMWHRTAA
jgi:phosphoketolase